MTEQLGLFQLITLLFPGSANLIPIFNLLRLPQIFINSSFLGLKLCSFLTHVFKSSPNNMLTDFRETGKKREGEIYIVRDIDVIENIDLLPSVYALT